MRVDPGAEQIVAVRKNDDAGSIWRLKQVAEES